MMDELRELLNKGGEKVFSRYNVEIGDALWTALYNHIEANLAEMTIEGVFEDEQVFAVLKNGEEYVKLNCSLNTETNEYSFAEETEVIEYTPEEEPQFSAEAIAEYKAKKDEEKKGNEHNDCHHSHSCHYYIICTHIHFFIRGAKLMIIFAKSFFSVLLSSVRQI